MAVFPSGLRMDFGRAPGGVIAVLDRELGVHEVLGLSGCPAQIEMRLRWNDLVLTFTDERFAGWRETDASRGLVCRA
ncbi:MAG: hypothetical protein GY945_16570 [Rhodobacteraceae bacterium]|nr:hypothetical protein [Paracoccaceae bacterium]